MRACVPSRHFPRILDPRAVSLFWAKRHFRGSLTLSRAPFRRYRNLLGANDAFSDPAKRTRRRRRHRNAERSHDAIRATRLYYKHTLV